MSVNYNTATLTTRLQAVANAINANGNGNMRLLDASGNILSTLQLPNPVGIAANGVLTFGGMSLIDLSAAASGTARFARIEDGIGTVVISGLTVNASPVSDIFLTPSASIIAGQEVAITAAEIIGN